MNHLSPYSLKTISHAIEHFQGDHFIAQNYETILKRQLAKGLDLYLQQKDDVSALLRITALLYAKEQYDTRIFHLAQAAQFICWFNRTYTPTGPKPLETLLQMTLQKIETLHDEREMWKNPALCARTLRKIEQQYRDINLCSISAQLGVNSAYLSRVLSQNMNTNFLALLHSKRILTALDLFIQLEHLPDLEQVSAELGYASAHYFYCVFKKYTGLTPTQCRYLIRE